MCKPPVAPLRQSHKTQIFFILVLALSLALQFLIVLPSKYSIVTKSKFRPENCRHSLPDNGTNSCGTDSFPSRFIEKSWLSETRQQFHGNPF